MHESKPTVELAWGARPLAGFGAQSQIKTANILTLSVDLPVVITAIDAAEKIERVLPEIAAMLGAGLIVVDETEIYFTRRRSTAGSRT